MSQDYVVAWFSRTFAVSVRIREGLIHPKLFWYFTTLARESDLHRFKALMLCFGFSYWWMLCLQPFTSTIPVPGIQISPCHANMYEYIPFTVACWWIHNLHQDTSRYLCSRPRHCRDRDPPYPLVCVCVHALDHTSQMNSLRYTIETLWKLLMRDSTLWIASPTYYYRE